MVYPGHVAKTHCWLKPLIDINNVFLLCTIVERAQLSGEFARIDSITEIVQDALKIIDAAKAADASTIQKETGDYHKIMNTASKGLTAYADVQAEQSKRLI